MLIRNRQLDILMMMTCWNSKKQTERDWREFSTEADERFHFVGLARSKQSELQTIEVVFRG